MKFSFVALRNKNGSLEEDQSPIEEAAPRSKEELQRTSNVSSIAWAVAAIAWATAIYLIERERQRAQVEMARLEMEAKKQIAST